MPAETLPATSLQEGPYRLHWRSGAGHLQAFAQFRKRALDASRKPGLKGKTFTFRDVAELDAGAFGGGPHHPPRRVKSLSALRQSKAKVKFLPNIQPWLPRAAVHTQPDPGAALADIPHHHLEARPGPGTGGRGNVHRLTVLFAPPRHGGAIGRAQTTLDLHR